MSSNIPSSEWKLIERANFAASLARQLQEEAGRGIVTRERVYNVSERIQLVLSESSAFLEANRAGIIEGQTPNRPERK